MKKSIRICKILVWRIKRLIKRHKVWSSVIVALTLLPVPVPGKTTIPVVIFVLLKWKEIFLPFRLNLEG